MKEQLALCSLALNPLAPNPTATMVKIEDGFMVAYGGTFCIRVPMQVEVGACFNPAALANFFRKERKAVSYKIHKNKLVVQEGKEKLSVPCLPPEEMQTLDVLGTPQKIEFDLTNLKHCVDVIDPAHQMISFQGVSFRYGMMESTDRKTVISAITDFDDELEFNLPVASAKALMRFKSKINSFAVDQRVVKFGFEDGSSLTSQCIVDQLIATSRFYEGEWASLKLKPETCKDLLSIDCDSLIFNKGNITYIKELADGEIGGVCLEGIDIKVSKEAFNALLKISSDIRISADRQRLQAVSETCRAISTTLR